MLVEKIYYVVNGDELERALMLLSSPEFALSVEREYIEMNTSKVTVVCLDTQVAGVEHILAKVV